MLERFLKHLVLPFAIFLLFVPSIFAKTEDVLLSSQEARKNVGQFLTTFTFTGDGPTAIRYQLKDQWKLLPQIYMFSSELMHHRTHSKDNASCHKFFDMSINSFRLHNRTGLFRAGSFTGPFRVVLLYADALTCGPLPRPLASKATPARPPRNLPVDDEDKDKLPSFLKVSNDRLACHLQLFNADRFGESTNHFGAEEAGLLSFFQLLTLVIFVIGCISVPKLWPHLAPGSSGSMRAVIGLTTSIAGLQFLSYLLILIHLHHYSLNGVEGRFCEAAAELLDLCCQFLMLHLLLSWSFAARRHEERVWSGPVAKGVLGFAAFQVISFAIGEVFAPSEGHVYHNYNGSLQLLLLLIRVLVAAGCALYLLSTTQRHRSAIKRDFFTVFSKICLVWFLCYPAIYVLASLWREYTRYKFTTITVCLCQSGCLLALYRLFLSRSLFWEVSALSGTLPIVMKFDKKTFGLKASP